MTRPADPRGASRRGATEFGDDIGYDVAGVAPAGPRRYHPPTTIQQLNAVMRMVSETGRCAICGQPAHGGGATCKTPECIGAWVFGR